MASIQKRTREDGTDVWYVSIRKKGVEKIYTCFAVEDDARLFAFYKERLIDNMIAFDVPIEHRITFDQIFELKLNGCPHLDKTTVSEMAVAFDRVKEAFEGKKFIHEISFDDWDNLARNFSSILAYKKGFRIRSNTVGISLSSLRKMFASISSCISFAQTKGLKLDNHPLKVMQTFINPLKKSSKHEGPI